MPFFINLNVQQIKYITVYQTECMPYAVAPTVIPLAS
jgi:hypothetical protein